MRRSLSRASRSRTRALEAGVRPVLLTYDNVTDTHDPATYIVPNAALYDALYAAAKRAPSVEWIVPGEARDFAASEIGVRVRLADGREIDASLLVAAEGRDSILREAAGIGIVGWSYPQIGIVTTVRHERSHEARAVQHFLPAGPFAILPLKGNRSCITWTEDEANGARIMALDDAGFLAEVERRFGGKLGAIALDGPRQSWPLKTHLARRYVGDRFALIGDAAHGVHPLAGQGLNLAFRDVAALVEVIADAVRLGFEPGSAQALARYERWRRFRFRGVGGGVRRAQPAVLGRRDAAALGARVRARTCRPHTLAQALLRRRGSGPDGRAAASHEGRAGLMCEQVWLTPPLSPPRRPAGQW